jgi:hypothetical protein
MAEYILNSGNGYFIRFDNDTPFMTSDPTCAARVSKALAYEIMDRLVDIGYYAELIKIIPSEAGEAA